MVQKLIHNTVSNIVFKLFLAGIKIFSVPIIVNSVGKEQFGVVILAGAIMGYFSFLGFGIPGAITKYISEFKAKNDSLQLNRIINTTFFFFLVVGLAVFLAVVIFIKTGFINVFNITPENYNSSINVLYIAAGFAILSWPAQTFQNTLIGLQKFPLVNRIQFGSSVFSTILSIALAYFKFSVEYIFISQNLGYLITWIIQFFLVGKLIPGFKLRFAFVHKLTFKLLFGLSIWLLILQICDLIVYQTDRILIGLYLPMSAITVYFVLVKPFEMIKLFTYYFRSAVMPYASEKYSTGGNEAIQPLIFRAARYDNAFLSALAVAGFYLSAPFIRLWMGNDYLQEVWISQVLCACILIQQSNGLLGEVYFGTGRAKKFAILASFYALLNLGLSIFLVQNIGVPGVLLATAIAELVGIPFQYFFVFPDFKISAKEYLSRVIVKGQYASLLIGLLLLFLFKPINAISTWPVLISVAIVLTTILLSAGFLASTEKRDRAYLLTYINHMIRKK